MRLSLQTCAIFAVILYKFCVVKYWAKHTQHTWCHLTKKSTFWIQTSSVQAPLFFCGARTMQDRIQSLLIAPGGLLESSKEALFEKQRVDLLKAIEGISG